VVDHFEALHLSSQSLKDIQDAIAKLHAQHLILMHATDEEQLVEDAEQEELQKVFMRLFTVITIYEDYLASSQSSGSLINSASNAQKGVDLEIEELPKLLDKEG
jgi:hypothetical protein